MNVARLRRASVLDPRNPEVLRRVGLISLYASEEPDSLEGLKFLRRAAELSPHNPVYWSDFASACESVGDFTCADQAFERSLTLAPTRPRLYWISANYYLRTGRPAMALQRFRRLLELSTEYALPTFDRCLRSFNDSGVVFREVLSRRSGPKLKLAYIDFLTAHGDVDFARQVWALTVAEHSRFSFSLAEPYLERLLRVGRDEEAVSAWQDLEQLGVIGKPGGSSEENAIYNGSFEQPPLNAGFDWRYQDLPYVTIGFPTSKAWGRARCLWMSFNVGRNEEYEPVYQIVPVRPSQDYLLTAYTRSEAITSDSGPRLRVVDHAHPDGLDASSDATVGTTPWHRVAVRFSTGPKTSLVRVSVWRPRSRTFPMEIIGQFWLDAVSLRPLTHSGATPPERGL